MCLELWLGLQTIFVNDAYGRFKSSSTSHPKNSVASVHLEDLLWRFLLIFFPNLQSQQHPSTAALAASAGPSLNFHAAVGVLVLSVAAAAVYWKVKPE
jgi:hypothetical protein